LVVTTENADVPKNTFPVSVLHTVLPTDTRAGLVAFLNKIAPAISVWIAADLRPQFVDELSSRQIPLILIDPVLPGAGLVQRLWPLPGRGPRLAHASHILVSDPDIADVLERRGPLANRIERCGPFEASPRALPCNEADRSALSALLVARPVWFAAEISALEAPVVVAAHARAARSAHRLLLILGLADIADGPVLRDQLDADGWVVGLRSEGDEPDPDVQIYLADAEDEMGLWYRLAPVAFLGRSLVAPGGGIDPLPGAALGSAILHGTNISAHRAAYERLAAVGAARAVVSPAQLGAAVEDLQQPERAAEMAHAAWMATTAGADAIERAVEVISETLAERQAATTRQGGHATA
jgi:3-deoxy-D-manno-octulosonic-acid transferase